MSRAFSLCEREVKNGKLICTHQPVNLEFFNLRSKAWRVWGMVVEAEPLPPPFPCSPAPCLDRHLGDGGKTGCQEGCQLTPWELLPVDALGTQDTQPALGWCSLGRAAPKPWSRWGTHLE